MSWQSFTALVMSCALLLSASGSERAEYPAAPDAAVGRILTINEAANLRGESFQEILYLVGTFRVTASGQHRMVLRSEGLHHVRVVVDLAASLKVPQEDTIISKDAKTAFRVERVRVGSDNQVTVYAREDGPQFRNE